MIYVAGASSEVAMVARYMDRLRAAGLVVGYDWTEDVFLNRAVALSDRQLSPASRLYYSERDLEGIRSSDTFWLLVPNEGSGVGCWVELGYALALNKRVLVSGDYRRSIFTARAETFEIHEDAFAELKETT